LKVGFRKFDLLEGFAIHEAKGFPRVIKILHVLLIEPDFFDAIAGVPGELEDRASRRFLTLILATIFLIAVC
jgi:hypothetical protein